MNLIIHPHKLAAVLAAKPHLAADLARFLEASAAQPEFVWIAHSLLTEGAATKTQSDLPEYIIAQ